MQRTDFRAAAAAAAASSACSLLGWTATDSTITLSGPIRRGEENAVRAALQSGGVPAAAASLRLQPFDGPYCGLLDVLRSVSAPLDVEPALNLLGAQPLARGELLRLDLRMPPFPSHVHVAYAVASGDVIHLIHSRPEVAGAQIRLGEPRAGFPGWQVDEPFGTDLMIVIASERVLFAQRRPVSESMDAFLPALQGALRAQEQQGYRVMVRTLVVETVARR